MPSVRLSEKVAKSLRFGGKREFIWDEKLPGFGVEIAARSKKYVVQYRVEGAVKRVQLGDVSDHSFSVALAKAQEIIGSAGQGRDVLAKAEGDTTMFRDVCEKWIVHSRPDGRPRSPVTIKDYKDRCSRLIYPVLGNKLLPSITSVEVQRLLATFGDQNRTRSYILTIIRAVFNFAVASKLLPKSADNPADDIRAEKHQTAKRVLTAEEIERFGLTLAAMVAEGAVSPHFAGLLRVSLLCGLRPGEAKTLEWDEVDLEKLEMYVTGKTGRRAVPLSRAAAEAIRAVPAISGVPYVFAGRVYGKHIVGVGKQLDRIGKRAGVEKFSPYAFRHTAATQSLASGADVRAVQALLGHTDLQTTTKYLHTTDGRNRRAAEGVATFGKAMIPSSNSNDDT